MPRIQKIDDKDDIISQSSDQNPSSPPTKNPTTNPTSSYSIQQFHKLSPNLQSCYTSIKQSQQSTSLQLTQQTTKVLIHLKQVYLQQQSIIVKGIKQMAVQSKIIIQDLTNIQTEIDKYHDHIEEWIKKIQESAPSVEKIKNVQSSFKKKANNFAKLKDFLNVQRPKRR